MVGIKRKASSRSPKDSEDDELHRATAKIVSISRTISACQRCRSKKTKCDSNIPCTKCKKAGVECIGLDSTGRAVPRSYLVYLEDKVEALQKLLTKNNIDFSDIEPLRKDNSQLRKDDSDGNNTKSSYSHVLNLESTSIESSLRLAIPSTESQGLSFYIGDSSGISFAKLLFTAVKFNPSTINEQNPITTRSIQKNNHKIKPIALPSQTIAENFIKAYFEKSNPQLPILHRETFIRTYFNPIYGLLSPDVKLAANFTQMNFKKPKVMESGWYHQQVYSKLKFLTKDDVPKEFHKPLFFLFMIFAISSTINLQQNTSEASNNYKYQAIEFIDSIYQSPDRLECLQGLLLLTLYSIMRPSVPGVWYVLGTVLRLCVDLGLHTEKLNYQFETFEKDRRRRLFWCAYSVDRQVCAYLGRPFGIPEESISTLFPSILDDSFMTPNNDKELKTDSIESPSYKHVSIKFFQIRKIQAEILQILYFPNSNIPRQYNTFEEWKIQIDAKIENWFNTLPDISKINCDFNTELFQLNYNHTKLLLFGITPKNTSVDYRIIFNASKGIIEGYKELHRSKSMNYTWFAVHHLFMSGTSFFYATYNSPIQLIDLKGFKYCVGIVLEVMNSLINECEAATICKEIFEILSLAVIKIKFDDNQGGGSLKVDDLHFEKFFKELNNPTSNVEQGFGLNLPKFNTHERSKNNVAPPANSQYRDQINMSNNHGFEYPSLSTPPSSHDGTSGSLAQSDPTAVSFEMDNTFQNIKDDLQVWDIMNQLTSENIWDTFFNGNENVHMSDGKNLGL